jgi:hypothetical protein
MSVVTTIVTPSSRCFSTFLDFENHNPISGFVWNRTKTIDVLYLGCKQRIRSAVNDRIGIEPET